MSVLTEDYKILSFLHEGWKYKLGSKGPQTYITISNNPSRDYSFKNEWIENTVFVVKPNVSSLDG